MFKATVKYNKTRVETFPNVKERSDGYLFSNGGLLVNKTAKALSEIKDPAWLIFTGNLSQQQIEAIGLKKGNKNENGVEVVLEEQTPNED